ncbi:hypothetical protein O6H91_02G072100 [Diphasiastrum complanatum]|nr:hypothetical protein O6H91_02G072100 [Diphasiastrum complanatum]
MVEVAGMTFTGEAAKTKKQAEKNAAMAAWSALRLFANQGNSTLLLTESEVSEEQEQNTIARALAKAHGKEEKLALGPSKQQLQHVGKSHAQRTITSSPSRMRLISSGRESPGPAGLGGVKQYHPGHWLPGELSVEPVQSQAHGYLYNQPHSSIIVAGGPPYRSVAAYPGQVSMPGSVRYHLSGLSREAVAANRAAAATSSNANRVIPTQLRSVPMTTRKDRHEVSIPTKEHQQDEDEWLHGGSVKSSAAEGDIQESSHARLSSSSSTSYNTMWSHPLDHWWNYRPSPSSSFVSGQRIPTGASLAPPVRVRSVTAVCAAPPRASSRQVEQEQGVGSNPTGDKDTTCEVLSQLRI